MSGLCLLESFLLAAAVGLMGRLRAFPAPQDLLCPSEGLGLWGERPELCSTLGWAVWWGQGRLGCWAWLGWAECRGAGERWGGAGLGRKVSGRGKHAWRNQLCERAK